MKKTIYICNRCKKEINDQGTRIFRDIFDTATGEALGTAGPPEDDMHLCLPCTREIMEEILSTEGAQEGQPKKRRKLDAGKVMALHRAGWSNESIAQEMRATERQVYQCLRYQREKGLPEQEQAEKEEP